MNDKVLDIKHLSTSFISSNGINRIVDDISLTLMAGETCALVGESGSGKSVTAMSILRLLAEDATRYQGEISFNGLDLLHCDDKALRSIRGRQIAMIFQEPMTALNPLKTIDKQILECFPDADTLPRDQARQKVIELLRQVKIHNAEERCQAWPHQLSGGQRQRVMIAMAIANRPRLLIADEPTTALDVTVANDILALLKQLQAENGMAILLITHDLPMVKKQADHVAVMKSGKIVEQNTCAELFAKPQHPYTRALLHLPVHNKNPVDYQHAPLLSAKQLSVRFSLPKTRLFARQQYFTAVDGACFDLYSGETLGIVGESGSGKSTLANALLRLNRSEGRILFRQQEISTMPEKQFRPLRQHIQVVFQDPFASLSPRMSVEEIIGEGYKAIARPDKQKLQQAVRDSMNEVGLDPDWRWRFPHEFSGGQRQRIAIARALIMQPQCIILDEPTSALDRSVQFQVLDLLLQLQQRHQLSYIFISHDLALIKAFCHRVLVMHNGVIIEQGNSDEVFHHPQQPYTQQLLEAVID